MLWFRNALLLMSFSCSVHLLHAQGGLPGSSSFRLKGSLGTSANFYSSNESVQGRPSYGWNVYGNFVAKIDELVVPFSFLFNQYDRSGRPLFFQGGFSPAYRWVKLHVGDRYMQFSPLIFEGQNFRGVGLELTPGKLRFSAFYGRLNKAVNEDTVQKSFKLPQYSRTGYGVKIGYGDASGFVDLIYFHAKDDSNSAAFINAATKNITVAQENACLGLSVKRIFMRRLVVCADVATSALTRDLSGGENRADSQLNRLTKLMGRLVTKNESTVANYAGQASVGYASSIFQTKLSYRRVQPNFKSFGTPFMINDIQLISWNNDLSVAKGRVNVNTSLSDQHNNLEKTLEKELHTVTGSVFVNAVVGRKLTLNAGFYGYSYTDKAGTIALIDTLRMRQHVTQVSFNQVYTITNGYKLHYISGSINLSSLNDDNKSTAPQTASRNLYGSLNYTLALANRYCSFSIGANYSNYRQDTTSYESYGGIAGVSAQLLKGRSLNLQGNIGYVFSRYDTRSSQRNVIYSINTTYRRKHHSCTLYGNYVYTPPNAINDRIHMTVPYSVASKNIAGGLSYAYTF